jgi:hypothetical protein
MKKKFKLFAKQVTVAGLLALAMVFASCGNALLSDDHADQTRAVKVTGVGDITLNTVTVNGTLNTPITNTTVIITLLKDTVDTDQVTVGMFVSTWFTNLPAGLTAQVASITSSDTVVTVTISGTPTGVNTEYIWVAIPGSYLTSGTPSSNISAATAKYNIPWTSPTWTSSQPFAGYTAAGTLNGAVYAAAYGNGTLLVSNYNDGSAAYSTNGGTGWTIVPGSSTTGGTNTGFGSNFIQFINYISQDNLFYAVGGGGTIATTSNGGATNAWTVLATGLFGGNPISGIAYGNGVYVITVNGNTTTTPATPGMVAWSTTPTDPTSWTTVSFGSTVGNINSVVFGNGIFIAVGQLGFSAYSADGKNWTNTTGTTLPIFSGNASNTSQEGIKMITYGAGTFTAVGFAMTATTTNGTNWTTGGNVKDIMGTSGKVSWLNAVAYCGSVFISGGGDGQSLVSTDGLTWTVTGAKSQFPTPPDPDYIFVNGITYGNNQYFIGGGMDGGPSIMAHN